MSERNDDWGNPTTRLWRPGRESGRTLYEQRGPEPSDRDLLIGVLDYPEVVDIAARSVNALAWVWRLRKADLEEEHRPPLSQRIDSRQRAVRVTHVPTGVHGEGVGLGSGIDNGIEARRQIQAQLLAMVQRPW